MGRIGLNGRCKQLLAALVVEVLHQQGIAQEGFRGGYIFHPVVFPQSVSGAEGLDTGFRRDSGAGKYYNVFSHLSARIT